MTTGYVVFAHGSRVEAANEAVRETARGLAAAGEYPFVEAAFLELGQPDLPGAVARLIATGCGRVVILPYFLTLGLHLERDLPRIVEGIAAGNPEIQIHVAPPLDGHPELVGILLDRARAARV